MTGPPVLVTIAGPARGGPLRDAVLDAAAFTATQLTTSRDRTLGRGRGPISHTHAHTRGES